MESYDVANRQRGFDPKLGSEITEYTEFGLFGQLGAVEVEMLTCEKRVV